MSSEIEAAGAAITAGLAGEALDPNRGHAGEGRSLCANCGATLKGRFCHACGQAGHVHRSLSHVFEEAVHGLLHFDGRALRTLPMLAFRPGTLTGNYIFGMRARYISPIALFLFIVFAMFFVFALLGGVGPSPPTRATTAQLQQAVIAAQTALDQSIAARDAGATDVADRSVAPIDVDAAKRNLEAARSQLTERMARIELFQTAKARYQQAEAEARAGNRTEELPRLIAGREFLERALADPSGPNESVKVTLREDGRVGINISAGGEGGLAMLFERIKAANSIGAVQVNTGVPDWDKKIRAKLDNPELGWYKIQNNAYKFAFLLVPLSLPFVALLFAWKRDVTLYDHAVFVLYSMSFVSLLVMALAIFARVSPGFAQSAVIASLAIVPVHMFFQLKGGYGLSWWSALWRTGVLVLCAALCFAVFVLAIILLGLVG